MGEQRGAHRSCERFGFRLLGTRWIAPDPRLSPHDHGIGLALLERPCGAAPVRD